MRKVTVCLFGFLAMAQIVHSTVAQEPTPAPTHSVALSCDGMRGGPVDCGSTGDACMENCFPANGCCDDYQRHPLPRSCFPAYPPWYRCVPAGDLLSCPKACTKDEKRSWWFIPNCQALREALWLDP